MNINIATIVNLLLTDGKLRSGALWRSPTTSGLVSEGISVRDTAQEIGQVK